MGRRKSRRRKRLQFRWGRWKQLLMESCRFYNGSGTRRNDQMNNQIMQTVIDKCGFHTGSSSSWNAQVLGNKRL